MALRQAIGIGSNGRLEEIPSTDTLNHAISEKDIIALANANASPITRGQVVYKTGTSNQVDLAAAGTLAQALATIGLVADASIAAAAVGNIQTDGVLNSSDWTAVTGGVSLTPGASYFLDTVAGKLTTSVHAAPNSLVMIGTAVGVQDLEISIHFIAKRNA